MNHEEAQYLSVTQVARILKLSKVTVYRLIDQHEIPAAKLAGTLRVPKIWLDQLRDETLSQVAHG